MKRLLFLLLLIPSVAFGWGTGNEAYQSAAVSGVDYTDCSELGNSLLYWNFDHDTSAGTVCKDAGTITASITSTSTTVGSATDPGTASPGSSDDVLKNLNTTSIPISSSELDQSEGIISAYVYGTAWASNTKIFNTYYDGDNRIEVILQGSNTNEIRLIYEAQGSAAYKYGTDAVPTSTWTLVQARWSASKNCDGSAGGSTAVKVGNNDWECSNTTVVGAWDGSPSTIYMSSSTDTMYIEDIRITDETGL